MEMKRLVNCTPGHATTMWSERQKVAERVQGQACGHWEAWGGSASRSASKAARREKKKLLGGNNKMRMES